MGRSPKTSTYYEVRGTKLIRKLRECPRCGRGVFLAEHANRWSCGKCGYTQYKQEKSSV